MIKLLIGLLAAFLLAGCDDSTQPLDKDGENQIANIEPQEITPVGHLRFEGKTISDVTGYVDPLSGIPYAVIGHWPMDGLSIVDASEPARPTLVAFVDSVPSFDMKYYNGHIYTVNGGNINFAKVIDVSDPLNPQIVGQFGNAHNIFIAENGMMFSEFRGIRMYDLNKTPVNPIPIWNDGIEGHDAAVVGNRLYDFHGGRGGTSIYDVSDGELPQKLATIDPPHIIYHHSGWPTKNGEFLYICDELAADSSADFTVWNISDLDNPYQVAEYNEPTAKIHNLVIIGDYAYVSYYTAGFRIFDVSVPTVPRLLHYYDTSELSGQGFDGAWGCYPFAPDGHIYISDEINGLFIFQFDAQE